MPAHSSLYPIQLTALPLKLRVADEFASIDSLALLPLLNEPALLDQFPAYVTAAAFSSMRVAEDVVVVVAGGGLVVEVVVDEVVEVLGSVEFGLDVDKSIRYVSP